MLSDGISHKDKKHEAYQCCQDVKVKRYLRIVLLVCNRAQDMSVFFNLLKLSFILVSLTSFVMLG